MKVVIEEWGVEYFNKWAENADRSMWQLLGIVGRVNVRAIEEVKKFLTKAWSVRKSAHNGNWDGRVHVWDHAYVALER